MPLKRVNKQTDALLTLKSKNTGLSQTKLLELAVLRLPIINLKVKLKTDNKRWKI